MTDNLLKVHVELSVGDNLLGIFIVSAWFLSPCSKNAMLFLPEMGHQKH